MKSIEDIRHFRQTHDYIPVGGIHESVFRSYQILERVKIMLARGDSRETIAEIIAECERAEDKHSKADSDCVELKYKGMSAHVQKEIDAWRGVFHNHPQKPQAFFGVDIESARIQFERLVDNYLNPKIS